MPDTLAPNVDNYVKGGAQILFQREGESGYTELGNIPEFSLATSASFLEHKSSRNGLLVLDRREQLEAGVSFKMSQDEMNAANLALILISATPAAFTQAAATGGTVTIANPVLGAKYDLGAFRITNLVAKRSGTVTLTAGTDYSAEADVGLIRPLPGGTVLTTDTLTVNFDKPAISGEVVSPLSKTGVLRGAILIFIRTSDGKLWRYKHTKASVGYEGDVTLTGNEFAKASGTVTIEPDQTQTDVYGSVLQLPSV